MYHLVRVSDPVTPGPTPVADFSANTTIGPAPLAVQFSDGSGKAPYHRWWQFGDGSSSTERDPVHTYERTGAYTVNLTVWTSLGQATVSKPAYIVVDGDPRVPEANFTVTKTSGTAPLFVKFTDTSTGNPTSWRWDFGGVTWTSLRNPSVVFRQPGTYPVTLTVRNAYGWSSMGTNVTVTGAGIRTAKGDAVSVVGGLPMSGPGDAISIVG
jgi:PKD repeat protein